MARLRQSPSTRFGLAAFLGTFLFIPIWDLYALFYTLRTSWRAWKGGKRSPQGRSLFVQLIRRLAFLAIAYWMAFTGISAFKALNGGQQPGPLGFLGTGFRNYADLAAGQECCDISSAVETGRLVSDILSERITNSLWLLAATSLIALLLVMLLVAGALFVHRLGERKETAGQVVYSLLRLFCFRVLVAPTAGIGLVLLLFLALRFHWFPFGGAESFSVEPGAGGFMDRVWHVLLPGAIAALLPALLAAQAGVRAWLGWEEEGRHPEDGRWAILGTEIARAFYEQAGWLLGGLMVIETLYAYPGMGALLVSSILKEDAPTLIGALQVLPFWLLIARARTLLTANAQQAFYLEHAQAQSAETAASKKQSRGQRKKAVRFSRPRPIDKLWLGAAALLLLIPLVSIGRGLIASPHDPREMDHLNVYQPSSETHMMGTDVLGRDVESRVLEAHRLTFGAILTAGVIALAIGILWGGLSVVLRLWQGESGKFFGDFIRIPAEAAILLHPALLVLAFSISRLSRPAVAGTGQSLAGVGLAIGMVLVPRLVWAIESLWEAAPEDRPLKWQLAGVLAVVFAASLFAASQYSVAVDFLTLGIQTPPASLGNNLSDYLGILAGSQGVADPRFYVLAANFAGAAAIQMLAFFVLQDALTDIFAFQRKSFLPRLLS